MHRSSLIDQWRRNLEKYKPNWSLGEIKAGVCDYKGKDIVFATFQSLMGDHGDKYPEEMWSYFGTICVDEMHVASAEKFGSVAPKFSAKYMLGVSGTIRRLDKTEACFEAVLGHIIHKADEKYRVRPKIFARNTNCDFRVSNDLDKVQLVSLLSSSVKRNTLIANDAFKAFKAGRFPVVMAERKEILEKVSACVASIAEKENISVANGFYIGGKSEAELLKALQSDIVYATVQMMKEGIDHPRLDTLLLATPMSDVEQCCGRVTRRVDGKKEPMVVDYVDCAIPKFKGSFLNRYKMYKKLGWEILGLERLEL
jgi:superfamily II DNA or RNA helicase